VSETGEWANKREERLLEGPSSYILSAGIGLWCTHDGLHWASWAAVRGGIVCSVQGIGELRWWQAGSAAARVVSERVRAKWCAVEGVLVHRGAGCGCLHVDSSMPCRCA
jgi:hypothetical protein